MVLHYIVYQNGAVLGQMASEVAFYAYQPHAMCARDGEVIEYPIVEVNTGKVMCQNTIITRET